jgi:hypothetical protein
MSSTITVSNAGSWPVVLEPSLWSEVAQGLASSSIRLSSPDGVSSYLAGHTELARLLPEICRVVRRELGPRVELSLELYKDPEVDDRYLTLYVRMERYEPNIMDHLQEVSSRFDSSLEAVPGYFLLATDFSRPRGNHAV